jgi:hypothetical protein
MPSFGGQPDKGDTMCRNIIPLVAALAALGAGGCGDRPLPFTPDDSVTLAPAAGPPAEPREALAQQLARALKSPVVRAYLRAKLHASPFREQKLHFQHFLYADGGHALARIAAASDAPSGAVAIAAMRAIPLEVYLPVPEHRAAWMGDGRVLVATERSDGEAPIAYDTAGNRYLLRTDRPPTTPVIALVPVETDFSAPPSAMMCLSECGGGGGGTYTPPPPAPPPGLYLTQAHFTQSFEGWLKGAPEFEVHILGQLGQTDSLTDYHCAGERQPPPYAFDQNSLDWTGSVMLFSEAQLNDYHAKHPGQNVRVYAVEDDDTTCEIKTDGAQFGAALSTLDSLFNSHTGGKDTVTAAGKQYRAATALSSFVSTLASLIKTNDELVGNAVADSVANEYHPGSNWVVKGAGHVTNGWIKLEMR